MNKFRKSLSPRRPRAIGLTISLLLAASLGSASAIRAASVGSPATVKSGNGPTKISPAGVRPSQSFACTTLGIGCNTTVNGALTSDDCRLPLDQSFYDAWTFQGTAGQPVQITMQASFDTFLILLDPSGLEVEENDDYPGGGTNSRISFSVTQSGTYTIYANSYAPGVTGPYMLQLLCNQGPGLCTAGATTLCLNNGRFRVQAIFSAPSLNISNAPAQAVPLTSDTGYFWFFSSSNVEIVIKAVDGRLFNGFYWVFYGALSDVQYTITVTDTVTGAVKTYQNTAGHLASVADTAAFPGSGSTATSLENAAAATAGSSSALDEMVRAETGRINALLSPSSAQACTANGTTLCLNNGRFQIQAIFSAPSLNISNAPAQAVPLTSDTGYFWFFSSSNVEIVIKAVDGRLFNGFYWVFYGALSDVQYTITVTDTVTGAVKTYQNTAGHLASVADTAAFPQ